jgi:hypothetical protein
VGKKSLVALDTDRIKQYVFLTDRLKEIRGASSILDRLNRREMERVAEELHIQAIPVYTNGGAGLFVVDSDKAEEFKLHVQQMYREKSKGRASITGVVQELHDAPEDLKALMTYNLKGHLDLMRYRLRAAKDTPPDVIALPSHPFMRPCNSCGIDYATNSMIRASKTHSIVPVAWKNRRKMGWLKDASVKRSGVSSKVSR